MAGNGKPSVGVVAVLVGAPVVAAIVFLSLLQGERMNTEQQVEQIKLEQRQESFDRAFDAHSRAFGVTQIPEAEPSPRAVELEAKRRELETQADADRLRLRDTMNHLETELEASNQDAEALRRALAPKAEQEPQK